MLNRLLWDITFTETCVGLFPFDSLDRAEVCQGSNARG